LIRGVEMIGSASIALTQEVDLYQSDRHGDWEHHAFVTAMERRRWATLLGLRTFLRYDDVSAVSSDPRFREAGLDWLAASGIREGPFFEWCRVVTSVNEGGAYPRLHSLVSRAFAAEGIRELRPGIAGIAAEHCDRLAEEETAELVDDFAHWMPVRGICRLLGIPDEEVPIVEEWCSDLGKVFGLALTPGARRHLDQGITELSDYVRAAIADHRRHPRADLITALTATRDDAELNEDELVAVVASLILGGHETTKYGIANTLLTLLRRPSEWRRLRADPGSIPAATEEALRLDAPVVWLARAATETLAIGDLSFEAGERILLSPLAANHDPARFPEPEAFDPHRRGAEPISFGLGRPFRVGAALARMEIEEALSALVTRFPEMELAEETLAWTPLLELRGPIAYRVTLGGSR